MISMISKKIVQYLITASAIETESDQVEVYIYGLECFLNTGITVFILFIWGFLTNTLVETCCWIVAFSILRHHSGGLHAPTQISCIASSCLLGISNWLAMKFISYQTNSAWFTCILCIAIFFLCAPTDTSKYQLTESMRKKEKLYSISILIIGFFIALILKNRISISILYSNVCVCILLLIKVILRKVRS
ncbi:MAG: accessory gene regulator B family protein [Lachnospiraceae bacterium]|nr:accessory gene regulator B family protein [Lachnospiraceae bacterium]